MNITPSTEQAGKIIYNLRRGIVPEDGFQYFAVGRQEEVIGDLEGLEHVKNGGNTVKILIGDFGSGKTLEKNRCRLFASKKGFVTSAVDFGPGIRLYANDGTSLALWKHLVENLFPSLETILDEFAAKCREGDSMKLAEETARSITVVDSIYFNQMILKYVKAYNDEDALMKDSVIRWLSGAYRRRDDARRDLGQDVEEIMTDGNWYNILKCFSRFVCLYGFSGLAIYLDEAINLYKIDSPALR